MLQDYKLGVRMLLKYPGPDHCRGPGARHCDRHRRGLVRPGAKCCGPRSRIVAHAMVLMGSGVAAGGGLVLLFVALGGGPTGRPADDVVSFAAWIGMTSAVMLGAGLLACIGPARRALRINPSEALREA
jgi:hypothetical protein